MLKIKIALILGICLLLSGLLALSYTLSIPHAEAEEYLTLTPGPNEGGAQGAGGAREYILEDPQLTDIPYLLNYAIKFMLSLSGLGAVFFIFNGAFQYISGFTIEQKQKGKTQILYAIVGLVVITLSYALVETLTQVLF